MTTIAIQDFLQDLVAHVHALAILPLVKISSSEEVTTIESLSEDFSVVLKANTKTPVLGINGTFGMSNLNKLDLHLKCPEYKQDAVINVITSTRNNVELPTGIHFQNASGDFTNDYRFMNEAIINEKLKSIELIRAATWDIEIKPTASAIQRLKFQAAANSDDTVFQVSIKDNNLIIKFGDVSTHEGSFVFAPNVTGKLNQMWTWPVTQVQSILNLRGDCTMKISNQGMMEISIDSGIAVYNYMLPAITK
jgi:hypothetical protein